MASSDAVSSNIVETVDVDDLIYPEEVMVDSSGEAVYTKAA